MKAKDFVAILRIANEYLKNKDFRMTQLEERKGRCDFTLNDMAELLDIYEEKYYDLLLENIDHNLIKKISENLIEKISENLIENTSKNELKNTEEHEITISINGVKIITNEN